MLVSGVGVTLTASIHYNTVQSNVRSWDALLSDVTLSDLLVYYSYKYNTLIQYIRRNNIFISSSWEFSRDSLENSLLQRPSWWWRLCHKKFENVRRLSGPFSFRHLAEHYIYNINPSIITDNRAIVFVTDNYHQYHRSVGQSCYLSISSVS